MIRDIVTQEYECDNCGHIWHPKTQPKVCNKCRSKDWNKSQVHHPLYPEPIREVSASNNPHPLSKDEVEDVICTPEILKAAVEPADEAGWFQTGEVQWDEQTGMYYEQQRKVIGTHPNGKVKYATRVVKRDTPF